MKLFSKFFSRREPLVSIDIGSSGVKLMELDLTGDRPALVNVGYAPISGEIITNNVVTKTEKVAEQISALLEANGITDRRAITAIPSPAVFTKRIKTPKMERAELDNSIQFEAANFIPHNIANVKLDYHIIGQSGKDQLDILVVAVKNEIIDSFLECLSLAGLQTAVVDVDSFALQNAYELGYPELFSKTVALIDMGGRFSNVNICRAGEALFTGDITVGGKQITDAIVENLGVSVADAEQFKRGKAPAADQTALVHVYEAAKEIIDRNIQHIASEMNRHLSFFWNASGQEQGIDQIIITGGGSLVLGLLEELKEKTGIPCEYLEPLRGIDCGDGFDAGYLKELAPIMGVSVGLAMRQPGDKILSALS